MGSPRVSSISLVGFLLALGVFILLVPTSAQPPPACNVCGCVNLTACQAFGANPFGPEWYFLVNGDGTFSLSTQAYSGGQQKAACDPKNPKATQTTQKVVPVAGDATVTCDKTPPSPNQTVYVEVTNKMPPPSPPNDTGAITRFVCAPP